MEKTITFSVAAYNVETFLPKCLDSFLDSKNADKLEVLIINDGSTDTTAQIAQQYCQKFPGIFSLVNKENGGHGSTINTAVSLAKGKYFRPIDGDDWIQTENLGGILEALASQNADMVICDFKEIWESNENQKTVSYDFLPQNQEFLFNQIEWKDTIPYHAIIYKTEILQQNNVKVSENVFYEDTEYSLYPIPCVQTVFYHPAPLYCYRLGRNGQSVSVQSVVNHFDDLEIILTNVFRFYNEHCAETEKEKYYKQRIHNMMFLLFKFSTEPVWYKNSEIQNKKRKLLKKLKEINRTMFLSYIKDSKLRRLQYLFHFKFDSFLIRMRNLLTNQK